MKQIEAITIKDIKDKDLYYIKITKGEKKVIINVGKKTYEAVKALDEEVKDENQLPLPLNEESHEMEDNSKKGGRRNGGDTRK